MDFAFSTPHPPPKFDNVTVFHKAMRDSKAAGGPKLMNDAAAGGPKIDRTLSGSQNAMLGMESLAESLNNPAAMKEVW